MNDGHHATSSFYYMSHFSRSKVLGVFDFLAGKDREYTPFGYTETSFEIHFAVAEKL